MGIAKTGSYVGQKELDEPIEETRKNNNIVCNRKNVFGKYDSSGFIQYVKEKSNIKEKAKEG